jgi:hypothetical protein
MQVTTSPLGQLSVSGEEEIATWQTRQNHIHWQVAGAEQRNEEKMVGIMKRQTPTRPLPIKYKGGITETAGVPRKEITMAKAVQWSSIRKAGVQKRQCFAEQRYDLPFDRNVSGRQDRGDFPPNRGLSPREGACFQPAYQIKNLGGLGHSSHL